MRSFLFATLLTLAWAQLAIAEAVFWVSDLGLLSPTFETPLGTVAESDESRLPWSEMLRYDSLVRPAQGEVGLPSLRPDIDFQLSASLRPPTTPQSEAISGLALRFEVSSARRVRRRSTKTSVLDIVAGIESAIIGSTDATDLARKSKSAPSTKGPKKNPITTDLQVRGNRMTKLAAKGSYWVPARMDLDTILSKLDSRIIRDMIVVKGPYSATLGPGFGFVDVDILDSPRFVEGAEIRGATSSEYKVNGEQWYARQWLFGGGADWGFRASYGHRTGNDYTSADGTGIPSSFKSRDFDFAWGRDFGSGHHLELHYLRLDQTDVEFPGQSFDIDFLGTDGFSANYVYDDPDALAQLEVDTWYNRTRFFGDNERAGKQRQFPVFRQLRLRGRTDVDSTSTGFRALGRREDDTRLLDLGVDMRYINQELDEITSAARGGLFPGWMDANSPIPKSHSINPGLFAEFSDTSIQHITLNAGSRIDWVGTNLRESVESVGLVTTSLVPYDDVLGTQDFDRDYQLLAGFVSMDLQLTRNVIGNVSGGYAQRAPSLTELYAAEPFMFLLQNGINTITGDPTLRKERLWQLDMGIQYHGSRIRSELQAFHAWSDDYITYDLKQPTPVQPLTGGEAQINLRFANTDATLTGFEWKSEWQMAARITGFCVLSYVRGHDKIADEPLPSFAPFESRIGVRLHDDRLSSNWAVENSVRLVGEQNRVANSLFEMTTPAFHTWDLRGYWKTSQSLMVFAGVENYTNRQYQEYLDFRSNSGAVFQPGVNFYFGSELTY